MLKENCIIGRNHFIKFLSRREKILKLGHFFASSFASLVLQAPQNGVFKTTISYLSNKIDKILATTFNVCPIHSAN